METPKKRTIIKQFKEREDGNSRTSCTFIANMVRQVLGMEVMKGH